VKRTDVVEIVDMSRNPVARTKTHIAIPGNDHQLVESRLTAKVIQHLQILRPDHHLDRTAARSCSPKNLGIDAVQLSYIASDLRSLATEIAELTSAPDNARQHSELRDLPVLIESLRRFGQRKPIVAKGWYVGRANVVIAGNGTLAAARRLGWTHLAVAWFEGTDEEAQAYALVDNRSAELSEWNLPELATQLSSLQERDADLPRLLGWDDSSLSALLGASWQAPDLEPLPSDGPPEPTVLIAVTRGQHGVIQQAIDRVRRQELECALTDGRCLELICADALAGPDGN
jgi:hypothetical protein